MQNHQYDLSTLHYLNLKKYQDVLYNKLFKQVLQNK